MAERKERKLSDAQKATLGAKQALEVAKKNDAAKSTDATKAAVKTAEANVEKAKAAENRDRFVRVAGGRVKKARIAIKNLANVSSPRSYTYDQSDVDKAETALTSAVQNTIKKMRDALEKGQQTSKAADDFSF